MDIDQAQAQHSRLFSWKKLLLHVGPGFLAAMAYVDPGNLEGDLQVGALTKDRLLWLVLWSTAMGYIVQMLSVKLGVASKKNLAEICREQYPHVSNVVIWLTVEAAIIGSDIQEVIGSAIAINLLSNGAIPLWAGVLITGLLTFVLLQLHSRALNISFVISVAIMCCMFGGMALTSELPRGDIAKGLAIPWLDSDSIQPATELYGAIIMPHNIFLHSALVQTTPEALAGTTRKEQIFYYGIEAAIALLATVFINCSIVVVFAQMYYGKDVDIGLSKAGASLVEYHGKTSYYLFAIGLLAAGQSSTMTGTYSGQITMNGFLGMQGSAIKRLMVTRLIALVPAVTVAAVFEGSAWDLDALNAFLNLLQSIVLPFVLIPLLHATCDKGVMGEFTNSVFTFVVVCGIAVSCMALNLGVIVQTAAFVAKRSVLLGCGLGAVVAVYLAFIVYLLPGPDGWAKLGVSFKRGKCGCEANSGDATQSLIQSESFETEYN